MCLAYARMCCSLTLANVSPSAREATPGAMRARTEVGGVCFCVHGASGRALCGDTVAPRWQKPAALRPSLLPLRPQTTYFIKYSPEERTLETERFNTFKTAGFDTSKTLTVANHIHPQHPRRHQLTNHANQRKPKQT